MAYIDNYGYDLQDIEDFRKSFGEIKILEVKKMIEQVKGKVKIIKEDRNRRAILLDNGKRWFSVFKDTKGFPEATGIVEKIDNNVSVGDSITL